MDMLNTDRITPNKLLPCLPLMYELRQPIFLWGNPGIGKSTIVSQFCKDSNLELVDIRLTQINPEDLRGMPYMDKEGQRTVYLLPDFLPTDPDSKGVIFLDELAAANSRLQASCYQLILERKIGNYKLPVGWVVWAAGNGLDSGAISYDLGTALNDRFTHFNVVASVDDWLKWGADKGNIHPKVLAFIKSYPEYLILDGATSNQGHIIFPSPRSWEAVSRFVEKCTDKEQLRTLIAGRLSSAISSIFMSKLTEMELPPMQDFLNADDTKLPKMIKAIKSIENLYQLVYGVTSLMTDFESIEPIIRVIVTIGKQKGSLPYTQIRALGINVFIERFRKTKYNAFNLKDLPSMREFKEITSTEKISLDY